MNKGIKAVILTSCVLLSAFVLFVSSSSNDVSAEPFTFNGVNYDLIEGETNTATVTGCENTVTDLVIEGKIVKDNIEYTVDNIHPGAFQGKSIKTVKIAFVCKEIPTNAFNGCINLESVELAEGFTTINSSAFADCTNLKKVVLPQTLINIGESAFSNSGVEEIDLKNVKTLGSYAFKLCINLKSVDLTSAEALLGTFYGCSSLEFCKLGFNLISMGENIFQGTSLKTIDIPASCELPPKISHFEIMFFESRLETINIAEGHKQYYSKDGVVYQNGTGLLFYCPPGKTGTLYIDEDVGLRAIKNSKLTNVIFSDRSIKVNSEFLYGNEGITEIFIPNNVNIGKSFLAKCSTVTQISIESGIKTLPNTFANSCPNLKHVDLPDTIIDLPGCFYDCPKLDLCIPESVKTISEGSFLVKTISVPEGITTIINSKTLGIRLDSQILTADLVRGKSFSVENKSLTEVSTVKYNVDGKLWYAAAIPDTDFTPVTTLVNGYDLKWFTDSEFKNPYVPGKVTETLQLYAQKTPIQYSATFVDENGDKISEVKFTVEDKELKEPEVPAKVGYEGKWSEYTLGTENITISPVYTIIEYTAIFVDENGDKISEVKFTVEDKELKEPEVPAKVGYEGKWSYTIKAQDLTISPIYTPIEYTATFVDENGDKISEVKFTVEDKELKEPEVPAKVGYEGKWSYTIKAQDFTITPIYTPIKYKISFVDENKDVSKEIEYTVETKNIEMPEGVPKASDDKYTYAFKYWANNGVEFVFNAPMTGDFTLKPYYLATAKAVKVDDSDSVVDAKDLEEVSVDITEEIKDAGLKVDLKDNASLRFKDVTNIVDKTLISSVKKIENTSGVEGNAYSLSITVDGDRYTGEMEITLPYSPTDGKVPVVYWINGTEKVAMKIISSDDRSVTFVTDHNSTYVVAEEEPAEESSNTTLYIAVAAVVIVLIAAAVLVARRH